MGGPMMGFKLPSIDVSVTKTMNCVISAEPEMIDNKTKDMIAKAKVIMKEIEENGGSMSCIVSGYQQKMIHESAWKHMKNVENRDIEVIGVNKYEEEDSDSIEAQELDINNAQKQIDAVTNNKKTNKHIF